MRKISKYTYGFSLWLAGIALVCHMLIPHDHHLTDAFSSQDENCPSSKNESGHHHGLPLHCHAFNDLTSEKARVFQPELNIQYNFLTINTITDISDFELQCNGTSLSDFSESVIDSQALDLSHLRAPPVSA